MEESNHKKSDTDFSRVIDVYSLIIALVCSILTLILGGEFIHGVATFLGSSRIAVK